MRVLMFSLIAFSVLLGACSGTRQSNNTYAWEQMMEENHAMRVMMEERERRRIPGFPNDSDSGVDYRKEYNSLFPPRGPAPLEPPLGH